MADRTCIKYTEFFGDPAKGRYHVFMSRSAHRAAGAHSLSLRLGGWMEAQATGWGIAAIPLVVILVLAAGAVRWWLA